MNGLQFLALLIASATLYWYATHDKRNNMRNNNWSDKKAVAQWLSARDTRNPIIEYLRDGFDFGDIHGSTMACLFAIADVLTEIGTVPESWDFRQSPFGSNTESWEYQAIIEAMRNEGATLEDLEHAAKVFERLDRLNRLTGMDY